MLRSEYSLALTLWLRLNRGGWGGQLMRKIPLVSLVFVAAQQSLVQKQLA